MTTQIRVQDQDGYYDARNLRAALADLDAPVKFGHDLSISGGESDLAYLLDAAVSAGVSRRTVWLLKDRAVVQENTITFVGIWLTAK